MVYENDSNSGVSKDTLSKQEIFRQIDQDILSQKNQNVINQQTKSNYRFVVVLDCLALCIAVIGIVFVHNIFREQQISLVSGQQGVKVLESTLLEEINKQYAQNIAEMEEQLRESNRRIADMELSHASELAKISEDAALELERQKVIIQRQMAEELMGKSTDEQNEIRRQYEERLKSIEETIERERTAKEEAERESHRLILLQMVNDLEREQQNAEEIRQRLDSSQTQLAQMEQISTQTYNVEDVVKNFDDNATALFLETREYIDNKEFDKARSSLSRISQLYKNTPSKFPGQRKESDSYFADTLQNYMTTTTKYEQQQVVVSNLEKIIAYGTDDEIKKREKLTRDIDRMIKRGDNYIDNNQYKNAVDTYQAVLRYTVEDQAKEVIQKLYNAILLELKGSDVVIPRNLESSVRKLLKETRYNDEIYDSIIYLKEPDGYIADIIDKDNILVLLLPRIRVSKNQELEIYRVTSSNSIQLKKITDFRTRKSEKDTFRVNMANHGTKLGDLIYIK